ncbi:pentatricopeptide repeat-containing protein At1g08070, chloroplastic-like [Malania oleifera]|uniref:pentatricopeptide repeat-containing protein At1g08070, chloroplastic-like n=1 Tax=Malania oleifera TaxID=397392 RepID=UPI0025AE1EEB|nr:pentatricopeptide repeat-containing protein At1g08070, chloroplastic-like [Malania oleifera]
MPLKYSTLPTLAHPQLNQIHAQLIKTPDKPHILNSLLSILTHSSPHDAILLYRHMLHHPTSHNHYTFTHALKACSLAKALHRGLAIHARAIKSGHYADIFIQNSLLHFYVVQDDSFSARRIFDSIPSPDVVSWTSIVSGLSKCGFEEEAIGKFSSMDVEPNCTTIVSVVSACSNLGALKMGKGVHGYSLKNLSEDDNIVLDNALLDFYAKHGSLASARYLFENMRKRDVVSWTTMIGGLAQRGCCEEAVQVFQEMVRGHETEPNEATLVNVLTACSTLGTLSLGQSVHFYICRRNDLTVDGNLGNALINMYAKCSHMGMAIEVFNALPCKDMVSWSTIVSGMAMNGHALHALQLFSQMLVHGVPPDDVTFISLLSACSHGGLVDQGLMFFEAMKGVYKITPQMQHYACVVDMYGRAGLLEEAEAFIREMPVEVNGPIWGALLSACKVHGNEEMIERISPCLNDARGVSIGTFALVSNAFAGSDRWDDANKVRDRMRSMGLQKLAGCSWIEVDSLMRRHTDLGINSFAYAANLIECT